MATRVAWSAALFLSRKDDETEREGEREGGRERERERGERERGCRYSSNSFGLSLSSCGDYLYRGG